MPSAVEGQQLSYLLTVPDAGESPEAGWPMLLFLHGAGERGDDLALVRVHGPPKLVGEIPELSRCVLLAPQCPTDEWWRPNTWTTWGAFGMSAASNWPYLPTCFQPEMLKIPIVAALAAAAKFLAECDGKPRATRARWCPGRSQRGTARPRT